MKKLSWLVMVLFLFQSLPASAHDDEKLSLHKALLWGAAPKAWEIYWTADCLEKNPFCKEANPLQQTAEKRGAFMAATIVGAGFAFYEIENHPKLKTKWYRKIPRYGYAIVLGALGVSNMIQGKKAAR